MWKRASAIGAVGAWMLAAAIGIGSSAWPDLIKPHPFWVIGLALIGALLIVISVILGFVGKKPTRLKLEFSIEQIIRHREPAGDSFPFGDLFIHLSVRLKNPASANVDYRVDLTRNGTKYAAENMSDVGDWCIVERKDLEKLRREFRDINPLSQSLSRTGKVDGWIHCRLSLAESEITNSNLRVTVVSYRHGSVVAERSLVGTIYGPLMAIRKMT